MKFRNGSDAAKDMTLVEHLAELRSRFSPDTTLLFLCRSGGRSHEAATLAAAAGYPRAFNILEGFEGEKGPDGRRGHQGWRAAGLPWQQG